MAEAEEEKVSRKDRKAAKKAEKEAKKKGKEGEYEEDDSIGSKILVFLVALMIIVVWLAIFALLIKMDVGGLGSTVLYPVLKDVPIVNMILPEVQEYAEEDEAYSYDTVDRAVVRIKELEAQIAALEASGGESAAHIAELEAQSQELARYKANEAAFEAEKEKFYNEVVFSDNAPDINAYREYYESIEPDNAAALYRQVIQKQAIDEELQDYVTAYSSMKPKEAAAIFDTMTDNLRLVARILENMDAESRGDILGAMNEDTAALVTAIMEP